MEYRVHTISGRTRQSSELQCKTLNKTKCHPNVVDSSCHWANVGARSMITMFNLSAPASCRRQYSSIHGSPLTGFSLGCSHLRLEESLKSHNHQTVAIPDQNLKKLRHSGIQLTSARNLTCYCKINPSLWFTPTVKIDQNSFSSARQVDWSTTINRKMADLF